MRALTLDRVLGLMFVALGAGLAVAGWRLPEGVSGVPGPGVFPVLIGAALVVLGAGVVLAADAGRQTAPAVRWHGAPMRQVLGIVLLLALYAALWDVVPFIWRTPVLLIAIYRSVGEPWLSSVLVASAATAVLSGVFDALLRVRL